MIKKYDFNYRMHDAEVSFTVDTSVFNSELAQQFLDFFSWSDDYDKDGDIIDEAMKKIAIRAIIVGSEGQYNEFGVIAEFEDIEGYPRIDGSIGIKLTSFSAYEFDESDLHMEISIQ